MAKRRDFEDVFVHCFLDGRDTPPASAEGYLTELEEKMKEKQVGKIASISGRFFAMDRDKRWDRVDKAYQVMVNHNGVSYVDPEAHILENYANGVYEDEAKESLSYCGNSSIG